MLALVKKIPLYVINVSSADFLPPERNFSEARNERIRAEFPDCELLLHPDPEGYMSAGAEFDKARGSEPRRRWVGAGRSRTSFEDILSSEGWKPSFPGLDFGGDFLGERLPGAARLQGGPVSLRFQEVRVVAFQPFQHYTRDVVELS